LSKELSVPLTSVTAARPASWLRAAGIVLAANVFLAVCAHIALPLVFTPVPLTLQTFAVLVLGLVLSPRLAALALATYLVEGAAGLPMFAPTPAMPGLAHLLGPTGGYLLAYPVAAALISWLWRRTGRNFAGAALSAAAGSLVILGCGALWLEVVSHAQPGLVLSLAVTPFLPGDALKIVAAASVAIGLERLQCRID
jgi:biotin transport system substrate-specific component